VNEVKLVVEGEFKTQKGLEKGLSEAGEDAREDFQPPNGEHIYLRVSWRIYTTRRPRISIVCMNSSQNTLSYTIIPFIDALFGISLLFSRHMYMPSILLVSRGIQSCSMSPSSSSVTNNSPSLARSACCSPASVMIAGLPVGKAT
jgi:hypothetical protein